MSSPLSKWEREQLRYSAGVVRSHLGDQQKLIALFDLLLPHALLRSQDPAKAALRTADVHEILPRQVEGENPDNALRTQKKALKRILDEFKESVASKRLPFGFELDPRRGRYELNVINQQPAIKWFWAPYFRNCSQVRIVYAESLFFRIGNDGRAFIRHMDVNDPTTGPSRLRRKWKTLPSEPKPGTYFVSAGDAAAVAALVQHFERNGLRTVISKADELDGWTQTAVEGAVVVGNIRNIDWLADHLKTARSRFRIERKGIRDSRTKKYYPDPPPLEAAQGFIARGKSSELGLLTFIASNHGRFSERYASHLFSEEWLRDLFRRERWDGRAESPHEFSFQAVVNLKPSEVLKMGPGLGTR